MVVIGDNHYSGYYVNGTARWDVINANGHILKYNGKWDPTTMSIVPDIHFEERMNIYARTIEYIGKRFSKSIVWKEKMLLRDMYGSYTEWCVNVSRMIDLGILSKDGRHLCACEKP